MPSAANVKIDKQLSSENALSSDTSAGNCNPLRQAITVMEHKIRNLEKRKLKLESYRDLQSAGKELNSDQKTAIAKYNEVIHTIEFAKDMCKQFLSIAVGSEKEAKKQAKKEAAAKNQAEMARLREILLVQDALNQMGTDSVRNDFLHGRNGAAQLSELDLKLLDDLYPAVTPKHEMGNPTAFTNEVQAAAEHLLAVVDGKQKDIFGGSYSQVKEILGKIHESGYFDQAPNFENFVESGVEQNETISVESPINHDPTLINEQPPPLPIPPIEVVPLEVLPAPVIPQPPIEQQSLEAIIPEQPIFFQQQQPRPITEMLGSGSFFFLQESEIDTPAEQIPSQTFTNQSFVAAPPPQQVPLPVLYKTIPATNLPPPQQQQQPPQVMPQPGNNGIDDSVKQLDEPLKPQLQQIPQPVLGNRPNKSNQSYYQNNGYNNTTNSNNRPRQSRNGPTRASGNRHN